MTSPLFTAAGAVRHMRKNVPHRTMRSGNRIVAGLRRNNLVNQLMTASLSRSAVDRPTTLVQRALPNAVPAGRLPGQARLRSVKKYETRLKKCKEKLVNMVKEYLKLRRSDAKYFQMNIQVKI